MNAAGAVRRKMVIKFVLGVAAANCTKFSGANTHKKSTLRSSEGDFKMCDLKKLIR